jgi:hypothetical protein
LVTAVVYRKPPLVTGAHSPLTAVGDGAGSPLNPVAYGARSPLTTIGDGVGSPLTTVVTVLFHPCLNIAQFPSERARSHIYLPCQFRPRSIKLGFGLIFGKNQIESPAALGMDRLAEVLGQLGVAGFEEGVVQGEGALLALVLSLRKLRDCRR